ncbi:HAD-IA family hydrolase [Sphingosinicella terrae]|uniref:HAD-IA family hydrolase n=1 Tax=Sphingosinicella terrae TaxID=2172047 RepID=UPI000E0DE9E6|nr:HAD-IA family hydrolase [Sphingosinicella terrae]
MNRLVIFDCDGTLVDSQHNICAAMEDCFVSAGLEPPARERTRSIVGLSLVEAMREMLPEAEPDFHAALAESYKATFLAMRRQGLADEPLYEGISDLLARLDGAGWLLGVATGKSDRGLALCLEHHGLSSRFVTLQTADRHPSKPHPSMVLQAIADAGAAPETTLVIGDTSYDMAMACSAGATAIGATWGYHETDRLLQAGAHHLAEHPLDILELTKVLA